jgi:hypothetical protein
MKHRVTTRLELAGLISLAITLVGGLALIVGLLLVRMQRGDHSPHHSSHKATADCRLASDHRSCGAKSK